VRAPYFRIRSHRAAGRVALRVDEHLCLSDEERIPLIETLVLSLQVLVESVVGGTLREASFAFAWAPPRWADDYATHCHGPCASLRRIRSSRFRPTGCAFHARWRTRSCTR
jgi:hypothetical protein